MTHNTPNLRHLLLACRLGNESAARDLWHFLYHPLSACANAILRDDHLARDAVQNAFLQLLRTSKRTVRTIEHPLAWMLTITRNEALQLRRKHLRANRREHQGDITQNDLNPSTPTANTLTALVEPLPEPLREIVILKHACNLTFEQASVVLDENRNTLASRYRRALELLRDSNALLTEAPKHA